jgi:hypothetical protein
MTCRVQEPPTTPVPRELNVVIHTVDTLGIPTKVPGIEWYHLSMLDSTYDAECLEGDSTQWFIDNRALDSIYIHCWWEIPTSPYTWTVHHGDTAIVADTTIRQDVTLVMQVLYAAAG